MQEGAARHIAQGGHCRRREQPCKGPGEDQLCVCSRVLRRLREWQVPGLSQGQSQGPDSPGGTRAIKMQPLEEALTAEAGREQRFAWRSSMWEGSIWEGPSGRQEPHA